MNCCFLGFKLHSLTEISCPSLNGTKPNKTLPIRNFDQVKGIGINNLYDHNYPFRFKLERRISYKYDDCTEEWNVSFNGTVTSTEICCIYPIFSIGGILFLGAYILTI